MTGKRVALLDVLRYVAGPQPFWPSPGAHAIGEARSLGLARDECGRIVLTPEGRTRLEALERENESAQ